MRVVPSASASVAYSAKSARPSASITHGSVRAMCVAYGACGPTGDR